MNLSTKKIIIALTSLAFAITMIISISYNNRTNELVAANAEALAKVDFGYSECDMNIHEYCQKLDPSYCRSETIPSSFPMGAMVVCFD